MAADDDKWQSTRESVNELADRLRLPPVFWEPPIDYRQNDSDTPYDISPPAEDRPRTRYLYTFSIAISLVLHGAVLGYAGTYIFLSQPESSASVETTASISVDLVDSNDLENARRDQASEEASSPAAMPKDGERLGDLNSEKLVQREPSTPDTPNEPDAPDTPREPASPDTPAAPDEPDAPSAPDTPDAPKEPEEDKKPDAPTDAPPEHTDTRPAAKDIAQAETQPDRQRTVVARAGTEAEVTAQSATQAEVQSTQGAKEASENASSLQTVASIDQAPPVPISHPRRQTHDSGSYQSRPASRARRWRRRRLARLRRGRPSRRQVAAYRRSVRAHMAANKPIGGQGKGSVRVTFILSSTGRVVSARVTRSSRRHALNQAALSAVYNASPFPTPPAGIRASRLRFSIPFYFH